MASKTPKDAAGSFEQDPWVDHLRPDPSAAPVAAVILEGLAGKSTRNGYVRLYFNTALNYYAEFASADMLFCEAIPPEQAPFVGHKATRVGVRQDAVVDYTRTTAARTGDPFALDIRSSSGQGPLLPIEPTGDFCSPATIGIECPTQPFGCATDQTCGCGTGRTQCFCPTDNTCRTDCGATCDTCRTCNQATCHTCNQATCHTCNQATCHTCNQATCHTCATNCGQATCHTCATHCNQATCHTCETHCVTCNPHVFTCGNQHGCL